MITNCIVVPLLFFLVCFLVYLQQSKSLNTVIAAGAADENALQTLKVKFKQNLFVGVFLLYPMITATLLRFPQCRSLGDDLFHESDYQVDCLDGKFYLVGLMVFVAILAVPVGVPALFLLFMLRRKAQLGTVNMNALGGAKLNGIDEKDDDDDYAFLIKDYRPQFWWYEIVT